MEINFKDFKAFIDFVVKGKSLKDYKIVTVDYLVYFSDFTSENNLYYYVRYIAKDRVLEVKYEDGKATIVKDGKTIYYGIYN